MRNELRLDRMRAGKIKRLDNGYVRLPITATRAGIFIYKADDGAEWRELRPPDEVFRPESMKTLVGIPVTNTHPKSLLDATNTKPHLVGYTSDKVERQDVFLRTQITLTDKETIDELEEGKEQVSCGYVCDIEQTPGTWNGQRYDAVQRNIKYNHVAIVKQGRAGSEVRVHLDDDSHKEKVLRFDSFIDVDDDNTEHGGSDSMEMIMVIDGVEHKMSKECHAALTSRFKKDAQALTDAKTKLDEAETEKTKAVAKADGLADELKTEKTKTPRMDDDKVKGMIKQRIRLEKFAESRLDDDITEMSDNEIITALIKLKNKDFKADGLDDTYFMARFDGMVDAAQEDDDYDDDSAYNKGKKAAGKRADSDDDDDDDRKSRNNKKSVPTYDDARAASMERSASRWQEPIGYSAKAKA